MTSEDRAALTEAEYDPTDPAVQARMELATRGLELLRRRWRRAGICPALACLDGPTLPADRHDQLTRRPTGGASAP
ncbi:hypothetical protein [Nocardia sp. NPDC058497]|uniref:hypothetical protein n=1 Tax=Nocardia sp. NPDC058497 TaxID=3346529 RepID=UPI00364D5DF6